MAFLHVASLMLRVFCLSFQARREGKHRRSILDDRRVARPSNRALTLAEERELVRIQRLGEEKSVALEWTLQDMVEDLALLYNTLSARAAKANASGGAAQGKDASASDREAARLQRMSAALLGFSESLHAKSLQLALMHPVKRDFLAKMLAIKALVSSGN